MDWLELALVLLRVLLGGVLASLGFAISGLGTCPQQSRTTVFWGCLLMVLGLVQAADAAWQVLRGLG